MTTYRAQLALLVTEPPSGAGWIHELKLDGYRIGVLVDGDGVRLMSRRGTEWTAEFPELVASARRLKTTDAVLDGEVVMLDERGISNFESLQNRGRTAHTLAYFAFDLLRLDGENLRPLPLLQRKERLRRLLARRTGIIRYTEHFDEPGRVVLSQACALGAEGIISKRGDAPYRAGARHSDWQKSKCTRRQEFVIGGFTDPSGSRVGVGSILVGYYEGDDLRFAGKVGTGRGWSATFGRDLRARLEGIEIDACPFAPRPPGWLGRNAHWVKPRHVVEVEFTEWTSGGNVRHPSLLGFRRDKAPREVVRERPVTPAAFPSPAGAAPPGRSRPLYPRIGVSRDEVVALYAPHGERVLPYIAGRPLTVVRCRGPIVREDALRTQCTFTRHSSRENAWAPDHVPRARIPEKKKVGQYLYATDIDHLLTLVREGVVEWHVWNARADDVERPDRIVLDLDPGDGVAWRDVVAAARRTRRLLRRVGLESWVKTTGGKGLHVVVPFRARHGWDAVFAFSRALADEMVADAPALLTTDFDRAARHGRILVDYKRNYRTSIAVAAYSPRANPAGTISMPVSWTELGRIQPSSFTVRSLARRLARGDPWVEFWTADQSLSPG